MACVGQESGMALWCFCLEGSHRLQARCWPGLLSSQGSLWEGSASQITHVAMGRSSGFSCLVTRDISSLPHGNVLQCSKQTVKTEREQMEVTISIT